MITKNTNEMIIFKLLVITLSLSSIECCWSVGNGTDAVSVLCRVSKDFRLAIEQLIDRSLDVPARTIKYLVRTVKSYNVVEPTPKETAEADKAMSLTFALSSGLIPDTNETMSTFCE